MSLEKKKSKKKSRKEKSKVPEEASKDMHPKEAHNENYLEETSVNLKQINEKYDSLFEEVGLVRKDHIIFKVKGNGACAANCSALHCHQDETLGPYVRRNVNKYLAEFWPFFKQFFEFPHNEVVGLETVTFNDESKYLEFLRADVRSGWLWMDHHDLQVVANM